ncbi:hypothetical protein B0H19DRAFT_1057305 [Mycena capillaripes]|nr:hypothetical protein B0H19DRAFT_1057305 [Mycena capillaripes]
MVSRIRDVGPVPLYRERDALEKGKQFIRRAKGPSHAPVDQLDEQVLTGFPVSEEQCGALLEPELDLPGLRPNLTHGAFWTPVLVQDDIKQGAVLCRSEMGEASLLDPSRSQKEPGAFCSVSRAAVLGGALGNLNLHSSLWVRQWTVKHSISTHAPVWHLEQRNFPGFKQMQAPFAGVDIRLEHLYLAPVPWKVAICRVVGD